MAWAAAGSIERGQDPAFSSPFSRAERSGHLLDSYVRYYTAPDTAGQYQAIQAAMGDGVDVINLSIVAGSNNCDRFMNPSGLNTLLSTARFFGNVITACAGNGGPGPGCTLSYYGMRADVLSINGVDSNNTAFPYELLPILGDASRGGMTIRTTEGTLASVSGIDLVAPGRFTRYFTPGNNYYAFDDKAGCSFATPVVSSVVGAMKNAFMGWSGMQDAEAWMVNTLLLGDGWDSDTGAQTQSRLSSRSGAGRVKAHWPSSQDLAAPWGWGWRKITINPGQTVTWPVGDPGPESPAVTQWKWAVLWTPWDLNNVPDVDFYVDDVCSGGGVLASDYGYHYRARFRLNQAQISNRCLQMRAVAWNVPSGGVTFYSADYFHSGDPSAH